MSLHEFGDTIVRGQHTAGANPTCDQQPRNSGGIDLCDDFVGRQARFERSRAARLLEQAFDFRQAAEHFHQRRIGPDIDDFRASRCSHVHTLRIERARPPHRERTRGHFQSEPIRQKCRRLQSDGGAGISTYSSRAASLKLCWRNS